MDSRPTEAFRCYYEPQAEQFELSPMLANAEAGIRYQRFHSPQGNDRHNDWLWVCQPNKGCLVCAHDVIPCEDMLLYEESFESVCLASMSLTTVHSWIDGHYMPAGQPMVPQENLMAFMSQSESLYGELQKDSRYTSISVCLTPAFFDDCGMPAAYELFARCLPHTVSNELPFELRHTLRAMGHAPSAGLLNRQIGYITSLLAQHFASMQLAQRKRGSYEQALLVHRAKNIVDAEMERLVSIVELAQRLNVSRSSLCTAFKEETGVALGTWAREQRCARAQELLAGGKTVQETARAVGYRSAPSFDAMFLAQTGLSPTSWRELQR